MKKIAFVAAVLIFFNLVIPAAYAKIYFFYGEGCPHCLEEQDFLDEIESKYPVEILRYEIYYNQTNKNLYEKFAKSYNSEIGGVPRTIIGDKLFVGFTNDGGELRYGSLYGGFIGYKNVLESQIKYCLEHKCADPKEILSGSEKIGEASEKYDIMLDIETIRENVNFPFIGKIYLDELSLPILTIVLGLLDGFNPCAMFVLSFLLVFLIATKSRRRVFLIGGIFLFISGLVYFLFISAWFNFFLFFKHVIILKLIVGVIVFLAGMINIKDFFFFQRGISLTLPKTWKPYLMDKMKKLSTASSLPVIVAGVITVAFIVNIVELMCTLGFPMIYTQILSTYQLSKLTYYMYLLFYCILYMVDDLIIFTLAVITLRTFGMTKDKVRIMKLISGVIMLILAVWFVFG